MPKKKEKKRNRRNTNKFSAVKPEFNLKIRQEEIEDIAEYFDSLPLEAKKWLNKFTEEYINDKLDRKKLKNNIHNTKELKQSCDARNNKRNRDLLSQYKVKGLIMYLEDIREEETKLEEDIFDFDSSDDKSKDEADDPEKL